MVIDNLVKEIVINLPYYNIIVGLAIAIGFLLFELRLGRTFGPTSRQTSTALLCVLPALLVGFTAARLLSLSFHHSQITVLNLAAGGLVFYGSFVGIGVYCVILLAFRLPLREILSEAIAPFVFSHAVGRIGCLVAGCCYGRDVVLGGVEFRFPTQAIESIFLFCLGFALWHASQRRRIGIYLLAYPSFRFLIEFLRGDDRGKVGRIPLSPSQLISLIVILVMVLLLIRAEIASSETKRRIHHESGFVDL